MNKKLKLTISLLGIEASGKTTVSKEIKEYLESRGYRVKIVSFYHWVFVDKIKNFFGRFVDKGRKEMNTPYSPRKYSPAAILKPVLALIDNIIFYLLNRPDGKRVDMVIFDRFICSTQIKFKSLGYNTEWLGFIWRKLHTDFGLVFDIPEELSVKRQIIRFDDPYFYKENVLKTEREEYLKYAGLHGLRIINNEKRKEEVKKEVIKLVEGILQ